MSDEEGKCRFNCRTGKEMWILGYIEAANLDMGYDHLDDKAMQKLAEGEYNEWKRNTPAGRREGIKATHDNSRANDVY